MTWFVIVLLVTIEGMQVRAEAKYEDEATCRLGLAEFRSDPHWTVLPEPSPCSAVSGEGKAA